MRFLLLVAAGPLASLTVPHSSIAATTPASARADAQPANAAPRQPLGRQDVDLLLREARGAIQQGKLDQAETLLSRAEGSRIHYSLFHMGATPTSVRRELNRARQSQRAGNKVAGLAQRVEAPEGTADPFLARNQAARQNAGLAAAPGMGTAADETRTNVQAPVPRAASVENAHPAARQIANPFSPPLSAPDKHAGYDAYATANLEAGTADSNQNSSAAGVSSDRYDATPASAYAQNPSWALPDAPVPPGLNENRGIGAASPGVPPQRSSNPFTIEPNRNPAGEPSKKQALAHLQAARAALKSGDVDLAEKLSRAASEVGVPESQFLPDEDRPSLLAWDIERARQDQPLPQSVAASLPPAAPHTAIPFGQPPGASSAAAVPPVQQTVSDAVAEGAERWAALPEPIALPPESTEVSAGAGPFGQARQPQQHALPMLDRTSDQSQQASQAARLLHAGESALQRHDRDTALQLFGEAHAVREELSPAQQQRLQDRLQMLAAEPVDTTVTPRTAAVPEQLITDDHATPASRSLASDEPVLTGITPNDIAPPASLIEVTDVNQQVLARQLSAEVGKRQSEAQRLRDEDPERAVTILREAQQLVDQSKLPEATRQELLSRIEITLGKTQKYIDDHRAEIELDEQNEAVLSEVDRRRDVKLKVQQKTAEMVDEFNRLRDEQRYAEMEIVAKRLFELSPEDPVVVQIHEEAKFIRRTMMNRDLMDQKEGSIWAQLNDVEESAINPVAESGRELVYDAQQWELLKDRKGTRERIERRTERELEIERRLKTPVMLRYQETPLSEVVDSLSQLTGVNIHLDPLGLTQEGINSDTPVTVNLTKEVSFKSALNLILEPLHLSYVVKDEVLKITSEQLRDGEIYAHTYNVADLVIPIPNFVPNNNIGLQGLINDAHAAIGYGQNGIGPGGPTVLVSGRNKQDAAAGANDQVLAQQFNAGAANGMAPSTVPIGAGPGGMGGGANADFDSLIDLIVSTVSTETWAENGGGEAEIRPFPTNLSLVISQTQAVHEEIADLLEQLRRLQDLQVTIEVRFIRLNDRFFERIGIDFDMNIEDRTVGTADLVPGFPYEPGRQSAVVGFQQSVLPTNPFPNYTADLDIPFRQPSFDLAVPPVFSGFGGQAASFGFAILSDIEAYFLIEAAQGDQRTNVLNAPKVTLFNGQQAFVADAVSQPFVIGVIPVVGEFVAAQQPVIVVLNEGTMMTIQAVVSDDRRYVRLTVVPFFTQVGDVQEFTFEGSTSTTSSSSARDDDDDGKNEEEDESDEQVRSGVTVQLPAFQFVSVVTTVSVPDGGTVLLGGIKRLSEGRNEFGVPLLSKVPYVNRLFRNIGIGRDTDSLMMMVTPRIIIQEEEEERLGIAVP
jgi:general secretion pathway protein D